MSKNKDFSTCPECGARIAADADACDVCGLPVGASSVEESEAAAAPAAPASGEGVYCHSCGHQALPGARFCSMCGTALQASARSVKKPARPPKAGARKPAAAARPPAGRQRRMGMALGAGALLAVAVYLIAAMGPSDAPVADDHDHEHDHEQTTELSLEVARQAAALEEEIAGLEGADRLEKQRALVDLFAGAGRYDRAAVEQQKVAEADDTAEAWTLAGNYFYDWAATAQGEQQVEAARRAIAAYGRALEHDPDDLDVRTDMAACYQWDPERAMDGIRETQTVLDANPRHVQANFNMGIFLMRTRQADRALEHFRKVVELEAEGSPTRQRAQELIDFYEQHANGGMGGGM